MQENDVKGIPSRLAGLQQRLLFLQENFEQIRTDQDLDHRFQLCPGMSEADPSSWEDKYSITLPPEYRCFLAELGDGNVGPGHLNRLDEAVSESSSRPFPLDQPLLGTCSASHVSLPEEEQWGDFLRLSRIFDQVPVEDGSLGVCDYGCGIYGQLILNGRYQGQVWILSGDGACFMPFGGSEELHEDHGQEWVPTDRPSEYGFLDWYEHWISTFEVA